MNERDKRTKNRLRSLGGPVPGTREEKKAQVREHAMIYLMQQEPHQMKQSENFNRSVGGRPDGKKKKAAKKNGHKDELMLPPIPGVVRMSGRKNQSPVVASIAQA